MGFHSDLVDGVPIDGSLGTAEDDQRTVDVAFDRMDIQVTFDGLRLDKAANLQTDKAGAEVAKRWSSPLLELRRLCPPS